MLALQFWCDKHTQEIELQIPTNCVIYIDAGWSNCILSYYIANFVIWTMSTTISKPKNAWKVRMKKFLLCKLNSNMHTVIAGFKWASTHIVNVMNY